MTVWWPTWSRLSLAFFLQEAADRRHEGVRLLQVRIVPGRLDGFEAGAGDLSGVGSAVVRRYDAIALAPEHQGRAVDAPQAAFQSGIVHERLPGQQGRRLAVP